MKTIWILGGKEVRDGLRNRWVFATILLLATLSLVLALVGSSPGGPVKASALSVTVASLTSLSVYLLPLIALMLSYGALVGEEERGTMSLLLTYPVARWQVVIGKLVGHMAILAIAIIVGYGGSALLISLVSGGDGEGWQALFALMGSSLLLAAVFLGLGYLLSALVSQESVAAGLAIGVWVVLVVIYDLALLGGLIAAEGALSGQTLFSILVVINPTDAYRIFNLTTFEGVRLASGMAGVGVDAGLGAGRALAMMALWATVPLAATMLVFKRREF